MARNALVQSTCKYGEGASSVLFCCSSMAVLAFGIRLNSHELAGELSKSVSILTVSMEKELTPHHCSLL